MLVTSFIIAAISNLGFWLVFKKLPGSVRRFMMRHALFTDFTVAVLTYILFAGSLTGLAAAAWAGIMVSVLLSLANNPLTSACMDSITGKVAKLRTDFVNWLASVLSAQKQTVEMQVNNG